MLPEEEYMLQYGPIIRWMLENDPTLRAKRVHGALRFHRRKSLLMPYMLNLH